METVIFYYFNYKPRFKVDFILDLHTVPMVGDFIQVSPDHITNVSKKLINLENIKVFGANFKVVKRTKFLGSTIGEDWRLDLMPTIPLEDAI